MNDNGLPSDHLVTSYLKYIRAVHAYYTDRGGWNEGSASFLASEVMMQAAAIARDATERTNFIEAGKAAFHALDDKVRPDGTGQFWTSKNTTFLLLGGGRYEIYATKQGLEPAV